MDATCGHPCPDCGGCCAWVLTYYLDGATDKLKLRCRRCGLVWLTPV